MKNYPKILFPIAEVLLYRKFTKFLYKILLESHKSPIPII